MDRAPACGADVARSPRAEEHLFLIKRPLSIPEAFFILSPEAFNLVILSLIG